MSKAPRKGRSLADVIGADEPDATAPNQRAEAARAFDGAAIQRAKESAQGVNLSTVISKADHRRLRQLSLDAETSIQQLGLRAWTLLLAEHGLPPLEHHTANRPSGGKNR